MILVFGKTGQVASELEKFNNTFLLDRKQADLTNPKSCANAVSHFKPKAVINAAAYTSVDKAEVEERLAFQINAQAPGAIAKACAAENIPMVHISTDYVFDGSGIAPWQVSDSPNPKNVYGRSKLMGERAVEASGCSYVILRTSWVVSAHGNNFVKTILRLSETTDKIEVVADQIGGPTCAKDLASACMSIISQLCQDTKKSGIYHYSGIPDVTWYQFANAIFEQKACKKIAMPITTSEYSTLALRPINSRLNCATTEEVFGIPRPYWRDGLNQILGELEKNHGTS